MCPQFAISISVKLQSRPCENDHATLDQLGPAVHHSSSFCSITISSYFRRHVVLMVVLAEIVCSRWQKLAKQVKILKLQYTRPLSIALKAGKSKPQEMEVNIQKIIFFWKTKLIQIKYLNSTLSLVFALFICLFQFN